MKEQESHLQSASSIWSSLFGLARLHDFCPFDSITCRVRINVPRPQLRQSFHHSIIFSAFCVFLCSTPFFSNLRAPFTQLSSPGLPVPFTAPARIHSTGFLRMSGRGPGFEFHATRMSLRFGYGRFLSDV